MPVAVYTQLTVQISILVEIRGYVNEQIDNIQILQFD